MTAITKSTKPVSAKNIKRDWYLIDVKGKILGRAATRITSCLQGKHKVTTVPYLDSGDVVVVINAKDILLSGNKLKQNKYSFYSGYPGGLREISAGELLKKNPTELIRHAVSGMLPKNKLRDVRLARLFIFSDEIHPYQKVQFKEIII